MDLNRNILRSGDSFANGDVVDQNFHHLAGQVFHMGVLRSSLSWSTVISSSCRTFIGSMLGGIVYSAGCNVAISFCVNSGFTMFGLVEQNYDLKKLWLK